MRIVKFRASLVLEGGVRLNAGKSYVMSDYMAKTLLKEYGYTIDNSQDIGDRYRPIDGSDLSGKNIMVWRSGGIGDLLFITPNIRYIKDTYNNVNIRIACAEKYSQLWQGHDVLYDHKSHPMPFPLELLEWADFHLHFEGAIESGGKAEYLHAVDLFSEYFHLQDRIPIERRRPFLAPTNDIDNKIKNMMRYQLNVSGRKPIIAIQMRASSPIRTFPERRMLEIIRELKGDGNDIILLDSPHRADEIDRMISRAKLNDIANASRTVKTIRDTISIIKKIDLLIAPDSSLTHIAGAIGVDKPTLALYGPFPSFVRTKYYPRCIAIDCKYKSINCSAPCYIHGHTSCKEAVRLNSPNGESPCFTSIKNKTIIYFVRKMLGAINNDNT
jgi:ADP-heptose:LPS heptosyltransferase